MAVSSAPGAGVRGILRLAGRDAFAAVFGLLAEPAPDDTSGALRAALSARRAGAYDDVLLTLPDWPPVPAFVLLFVGPRSYTGDDVAELHVPGSPVLLRALVGALLARGTPAGALRHAEPGEFTFRAYCNGRLDVTQAEAVSALIGAREPAAAVEQFASLAAGRGSDSAPAFSLAGQARTWRERLSELLARTELALDFSEDEDFWHVADPPRLAAELAALGDEVDAARSRRAAGTAERGDVPNVVLAGPANAGKSSLVNALGGSGRAIVTRRPGTTRDALAFACALPAGPHVRIWDTAGLREDGPDGGGGDAGARLDADAVAIARDVVRGADVLVWCWPADVAPARVPDAWVAAHGRDWLLCQTKADLSPTWSVADEAARHGVVGVSTSARRPGETLAAFGRAVGERLSARQAGERNRPGVVANARQAAHLEAAAGNLRQAAALAPRAETVELASAEMHAAERELAALLGVDPLTGVASETLLARIFSTFCLGK